MCKLKQHSVITMSCFLSSKLYLCKSTRLDSSSRTMAYIKKLVSFPIHLSWYIMNAVGSCKMCITLCPQKPPFWIYTLKCKECILTWLRKSGEKHCPLGLWLCCSSGLDVVKKFTSLEGHFQYESQAEQSMVKGRGREERIKRRHKGGGNKEG